MALLLSMFSSVRGKGTLLKCRASWWLCFLCPDSLCCLPPPSLGPSSGMFSRVCWLHGPHCPQGLLLLLRETGSTLEATAGEKTKRWVDGFCVLCPHLDQELLWVAPAVSPVHIPPILLLPPSAPDTWPFFLSFNRVSSSPPQGLCTGSSCCLECSGST